ncbi:MAG: diguanylate cyclase [Sphingobacteriia bacterium]|nr:diguanylate cyclase [Sphingobacteriia bacterium]NCC38562.1 diguanylate cyclase [Gammaproteobacteria bacterium]
MNDHTPIILAVDDNVENLDILSELLADYDVRDVTDATSALQILDRTRVDLILLDIMMPEIDGFELCRLLQSQERTRTIPIIFISAMSDEATIERAFEVGGKDYVTKPFRPRELISRVKTHLDLKFMMERLQFLAFHDSLTGIYNRRRFFELATLLMETEESLYAVMLDIDHFKKINDQHGHAVGDVVLKQVVACIAKDLPPRALFGRLGGEEFAILIPDVARAKVVEHVEGLRGAVERMDIPADTDHIHCTVSCGLAARVAGSANIDDLLNSADMALYRAKTSGRNRVEFI